jgi:hypothetical protein
MKSASGNPQSNVLGPGVSEPDLLDAIASSGYPLQSIVARILRKNFSVQEEWGFIDSDDEVARSMDMMAERPLYTYKEPQPFIRPTLNLLVECKRSDLPYVFFSTSEAVWTPRFPLIAGLGSEEISISTDDDPSTWVYPPVPALGLQGHKFLTEVAFATNFTRCERQGAKLRLSGSEPYNSLVQPLVKALDHFKKVESPPSTAVYFDIHAAIGLAVLDAPMMAVSTDSEEPEVQSVPWVRVPRHKGLDGRSHEHRTNVFAIDVVHVGFLQTYIDEHLLPFASAFSEAALKHHVELAEGKAFVPEMGSKWHKDVEPLMTPRSMAKAVQRVSSAAKTALRRATKKSK